MRTLLICALATTLVGCSSQQSAQPSCVGLNPLACLTAVHVPIEPASYDSDSVTAKPVSDIAWRDDSPPRSHAYHAVRRNTQADQGRGESRDYHSHTDSFSASEPADDGQCRCFRSELALPKRHAQSPPIRIQRPTFRRPERHRSRWRPPLPSRSECRSRHWMRRWTLSWPSSWRVPTSSRSPTWPARQLRSTINIPNQSISRVRTAMAAAGALEVQLSKGQTTAINRLVAKEVAAAIVGLVSVSAADSFPELPRLRTFRIPLSPRSSPAKP